MVTMDKPNGNGAETNPANELAKALQELARGERTATELENHLSSIEKRIDQMLQESEYLINSKGQVEAKASSSSQPPGMSGAEAEKHEDGTKHEAGKTDPKLEDDQAGINFEETKK